MTNNTTPNMSTMMEDAKTVVEDLLVLTLPKSNRASMNQCLAQTSICAEKHLGTARQMLDNIDTLLHIPKLKTPEEFRKIECDPHQMAFLSESVRAIKVLLIHVMRHMSFAHEIMFGYLVGYVPYENQQWCSDGFQELDKLRIDLCKVTDECLDNVLQSTRLLIDNINVWQSEFSVAHLPKSTKSIMKTTDSLIGDLTRMLNKMIEHFSDSDDENDE